MRHTVVVVQELREFFRVLVIMALTVSFGNSTSSTIANWGFMLLILSIFLFFTGLWKTIGNKWSDFFGSGLWTQTIGNIKTTWSSVPATTTTSKYMNQSRWT